MYLLYTPESLNIVAYQACDYIFFNIYRDTEWSMASKFYIHKILFKAFPQYFTAFNTQLNNKLLTFLNGHINLQN